MNAPVLSDAELRRDGSDVSPGPRLLPMCPDAICDGEEHWTGRRDPRTGEDEVEGPCPRWGDRGSVPIAAFLVAVLLGGLLALAVLALQPAVCALNPDPADQPRYCAADTRSQ